MTIEAPPLWLQGGTYPARIDRLALAEMREEGVADALACKVSQRAGGANMTVDIAVGGFWVQGDDQALQGTYQGRITAVESNVAFISPPTGSDQRYDIVCLRVNDPNAGSAQTPANTVVPIVVAGAAAPTPVVPALPNSCLPIAVVGPITSSTPSVTTSMIHDCWTGTGPTFAFSCRRLAGDRVPVGEMRLRATNPDRVNGWLWCNGQSVLRSAYPALFAELGTTYGPGSGGSTTFALPDLRDRVPIAAGSTLPAVGSVGGEFNHFLTLAQMPAHDHGGVTGTVSSDHTHAFTTSGNNVDHSHTFSGWTDGRGDHNHYSSGDPAVNLVGAVAGGGQTVDMTAGAGMPIGFYTLTNVAGGHQHYYEGTTSGENTWHYHTGQTGGIDRNHNHSVSVQGSGGSFNVTQPYQVLGGWMIKAT